MPRTITIGCQLGGQSMYSVLQRALKLLDAAGVEVHGAAQNVHADLSTTATILLRYSDDKARAVGILERAGILVQR
jgi:hypothetical protein